LGRLQTYPGEQPQRALGPESCGVTTTPGVLVGLGHTTIPFTVTVTPGPTIVGPGTVIVFETGGSVTVGPGAVIVVTTPGRVVT